MSNISPIIPDNITYNDLKYRLQNIQCCLPNKAVELYNRINLGINCCNEERELNVAMAYLDMLKCYITNWKAPYKYEFSNIQGPIATFDIIILYNEGEYDENSAIFNSFNCGFYGQSYSPQVSMVDIINNYVADTGLIMTLDNVQISINVSGSYTIFTLTAQVPCEYAETAVTFNFSYFGFQGTSNKVNFGPCTGEIISIEGPTYTNQDSANCLSREEVVNMFEWLQKYCCMCFPNYGNYDNIVEIAPK